MNPRKMSLIAMLTALAVAIGVAESFIPSIGIPGVKLGLANIIILITLYELGIKEAIAVNAFRVFLVGMLRGSIFSMGFLMSLTGATLSLTVMIIFYLLIKKFSVIGVSVIGSMFHIFGQVLIAMIFMGSAYILLYLPFIAVSAVITGIFVGLVAKVVINTKIVSKQKERYKL